MFGSIPFYITSLEVLKFKPPTGDLSVAPRHFHTISYCISGKMDIFSGDYTACSKPGSITFIPQGGGYRQHTQDREIIAVHFAVRGELPHECRVITPPPSINIGNDFEKLLSLYESPDPDRGFACMAQLYNLLSKIFSHNGFKHDISGYDRRIQPAVEYLNENFSDKNASDVTRLAALCGFSSTYLRRIFLNEFGMTTNAYIKQFRVNKAKAMLDTGLYPVTEVAIRCGFNSTSYFSKEFKRVTGYTPSEYLSSNPYNGMKPKDE